MTDNNGGGGGAKERKYLIGTSKQKMNDRRLVNECQEEREKKNR